VHVELFETSDSQILVFICDGEFRPVFFDTNVCCDKSIRSVLACSVRVDDGAKCGRDLGGGSNFQLVKWP